MAGAGEGTESDELLTFGAGGEASRVSGIGVAGAALGTAGAAAGACWSAARELLGGFGGATGGAAASTGGLGAGGGPSLRASLTIAARMILSPRR